MMAYPAQNLDLNPVESLLPKTENSKIENQRVKRNR